MNSLITVIIPVYNVAPYLKNCINSVINQSYQNLEIILIDDGSNDGSENICDELKKLDNRIQVIHKTNKGVSAARNTGIEKAKGEYITFIDSDDRVDSEMIERMYYNAIKYNVDISCCLLDVVEPNKTVKKPISGKYGLFPSKEIISLYFSNQFIKDQTYGPFNKLISSNLIKRHKFDSFHLGEDILFMFELLLDSKQIYYDNYVGYHYLQREGSAMKSKFSKKRLDYIFAGEKIIKLCKQHAEFVLESAIRWLYIHKIGTLRQILIANKKEEFKEYFLKEKKYLKLNSKYLGALSISKKLDYFGIFYFPFYFKLLKILNK